MCWLACLLSKLHLDDCFMFTFVVLQKTSTTFLEFYLAVYSVFGLKKLLTTFNLSMFQGTYWKIVLAGLLITVALYMLSNHSRGQKIFLLHGKFYYNNANIPSEIYQLDMAEELNLASTEIKVHSKQYPNLSPLEVLLTSQKVNFYDKQQPNISPKVANLSPEVSPELRNQSSEISSGVSDLSPEVLNLSQEASPEAPPKTLNPLLDVSPKIRNLSLEVDELSSEKRQPNLLSREVRYIYEQQPDSSTTTPNIVEMYHHLLGFDKYEKYDDLNSQTSGKEYIESLPSSQVSYMVTQMVGVSNLTSRKAKEQFLKCAGFTILQELELSQLNSTIPIPESQQHCKQKSFKSSGPVVALVSYPGSGNSWVRQLLESATGIYTGAVYCDPAYVEAEMIGEGVQTNNVLAIKLHQEPFDANQFLDNEKAIYIVRSPFGAILAENNRFEGGSHTLEADYNYSMYTVCICTYVCVIMCAISIYTI